MLAAEVDAAGEVFVDLGSRELVEPEALPARAPKRCARAERQLDARFEPQPARIKLGQRLVERGYAVQKYWSVTGEVLGEQHMRSLCASATSATRVPIASIAKMTRPSSVSR